MNSEKRFLQPPSVAVTDDREARPLSWYVAYTRVHQERKVVEQVMRLGIEAYVPVQKEWRQWSDRRKLIDRIVTPLMAFVRCTAQETYEVERLSPVTHFLRVPGSWTKATIPDAQMDTFRFAIERAQQTIELNPQHLTVGDMVKVCVGPLAGLEGRVAYTRDGSPMVIIQINYLGCAGVKVRREELMRVNES